MLLLCLTVGLFRLVVTGFGIGVASWFFPAVAGVCLFAAVLYQSEWCARYGMILAVILLLAYLAALYVNQTPFLLGMQQFINAAVEKLNDTYSGSLGKPFSVTGINSIGLFLAFLIPPVVFWLSAAVLHSNGTLMMELLVFPAVAALLLFGAAEDTVGKFLLLFGVVLSIAFTRTKRQRRMWGGKNKKLLRENRLRFENIQKVTAIVVLMISVALTVPGFLLVRPLLAASLQPARTMSTELQTDTLNRVMKLLPDLTAGQWNLNVSAVSGGVQDGSILGESGYLLEGVEDLRLTLTQKPENALFLKGYVGATYENGAWVPGHAYSFDGAAINWNTDGSPRLFIQNLPFLRTTFSLSQSGAGEESIASAMSAFSVNPVQLYVQRINANDGYTYVPYGAYLNDYYQVEAGDGYVAGQHAQEDRYFFFSREDMEAVLEAWNGIDETANVLDRVEESYRAFCTTSYSAVPDGLDTLQAEVDAVKTENRWQTNRDLDEISTWIRHYLAQNYHYDLLPPQVPEGEDALLHFLFTSRRGNSVHFASAAVVLYRMFGIPARYVVGYEVPPVLFTVQAGGLYTATIQGDNSQAWAEIYLPGIGWSPRDMTPGVIGTLEEVGPNGIRVETPVEESDAEEQDALSEAQLLEEDTQLEQTDIQTDVLAEDKEHLSLETVIHWIAMGVSTVVVLLLLSLLTARIVVIFGLPFFGLRSYRQRLLGVFQAVYRRARRLKWPAEQDSQSEQFQPFLEDALRRRRSPAATLAAPAMEALFQTVYGDRSATKSDVIRMRKILLGLYQRKGSGEK